MASADEMSRGGAYGRQLRSEPISITTRDRELSGELVLPGEMVAAVVLVQVPVRDELGAGASVVARFEEAGIASLRIGTGASADRSAPEPDAVAAATAGVDRLHEQLPTAGIPVGVLGVGGGAGAALLAAGERPERVRAVVCVGGDPGRVPEAALARIEAPVLLVVGDEDTAAFERFDRVVDRLSEESALEILAGAGDAATDRRSAELVCDLATAWFRRHLGPGLPAATETSGG
jgi:pimeloyl-ACP methyl ester carboxylesterase